MSPIDPNKIMIPDPSPKQQWKNRRMIRKGSQIALGILAAILGLLVFTNHEELAMPFGILIIVVLAIRLLLDIGDQFDRDSREGD